MKKNIVISLIIILIIFIIGIFGYKKFIEKDSKQTTTKEINEIENDEVEKEINLNSDIVKRLSKVVGAYRNDETTKYNNYFYKKDKIVLSEEPIEFKLSLASLTLADEDIKASPSNSYGTSYIAEEKVKRAYKELFGNYGYTKSNFQRYCLNFNYSEENNQYEASNSFGCGGTNCVQIHSKIAKAIQSIISTTNNKIEIYENILIDKCSEGIYADYSLTKFLSNGSISNDSQLFEQGDTYKYTFIQGEDDNYIFSSVEKVE